MRNLDLSFSFLFTLAAVLPTMACGLPDDDPELRFRTTVASYEGGNEIPECLVVTTKTVGNANGDGHDTPPPPEDDGDDRAPPQPTGDDDEGEGGEAGVAGPPDDDGGDDFGLPPSDPDFTPNDCPGVNRYVTVQAQTEADAEAVCQRAYGQCCADVCEQDGLVPKLAQASCAFDNDPQDWQIDDLTHVGGTPGNFACGCECMQAP